MSKFRPLLLELSNAITENDLARLKFACTKQIPAGTAEKIKGPHDFFSELERLSLLAHNNREFLASRLESIGRPDLRNKLLGIDVPSGPRGLDRTPVPEELITELVVDLSTYWKMVGRYLHIKEAILTNIEDEKRRVVERAIAMFAVWKTQYSETCTFQALIDAFVKAGRLDLAERVKDWVDSYARAHATEHGQLPRPGASRVLPFPTMQDLDHAINMPGTMGREPEEHGGAAGRPHQVTTQQEVVAPIASKPVESDDEADSNPVHPLAPAAPSCSPADVPAHRPVQKAPSNPVGSPVQESEVTLNSKGRYLNPNIYRTEHHLGSGSFGEVYETKSRKGSKHFAVKLIDLGHNDPNTQQKCLEVEDKIRTLSVLESHFIVKYLHTKEERHTLAIFSPYMAGGSIKDWVRHNDKIAVPRVRTFTWQILKGLEFLHGKEIIHRNLKGANVLLDEGGNNVKLADYGIDQVMRELCDCSGKNKATLNTDFHWSSPELLQGQMKEVTSKTDIWSLGCTVCEMLTQHPPLANRGYPPMTVMFKYCNHEVDVPPGLSSLAYGFFDMCFKNAVERPTATDLLEDAFPCKTSPS